MKIAKGIKLLLKSHSQEQQIKLKQDLDAPVQNKRKSVMPNQFYRIKATNFWRI